MISNGMGGYDWGALELAVEFLGIQNVEMLIHRLVVIKTHSPKKDGGQAPSADE